jgi:DNA adenine methylase
MMLADILRVKNRKKCNFAKKNNDMTKARPFVKWVGGKKQLLEQFENYYYPNELLITNHQYEQERASSYRTF